MNAIGDKVKAIRLQHNLKQVTFAEKIRISQGRLSEIEQGKTKPSAETLFELRKQFNVDLNWLFEEEN
ncbi:MULTISPECIES: helix-turn-helix domain-containing protein [Paenibacillus]|uniref:Helix-turn-helix transcriptional regulator n=2 Tax=Paenibacillus TaxID=44249 RepID=A0A5J5FQN7_9BACL|nr:MULTISPECIES: helix-turn-helix transcriptional regulator [Paenibacillus]KAA8995295.1 helix-turn-helix transcriptional regulator [Paenibacillus spiritus]SDJ05108.1 DNA-binding transcriptional regulator, XRE-family HTH domain [Paenibacillus typhae]